MSDVRNPLCTTPNTSSCGNTVGTLQLILGPMFSGKSTRLLHETNSLRAIGKRVLFINPRANRRYTGVGITTHDTPTGPTHDAPPHFDHMLSLEDIRELQQRSDYMEVVHSVDVICIEEIQFFHHTVDTIRYLVETLDKHVLCAGLIADYKRRMFGDVLELIPLADDIVQLKALCTICNNGTAGIFTQRLPSANTSVQVLLGARDVYRSVCRAHYMPRQPALVSTPHPPSCEYDTESTRRGGIVPWYVDDVQDE